MAELNIFEKLLRVFPSDAMKKKKRDNIFSAQEAYSIARHGSIKTIGQLVSEKQESISKALKSRLNYNDLTDFTTYNYVVELDRDLRPYADNVFAPFKEKGYTIFNVNEKFPEIGDCAVFIINWANCPFAVETSNIVTENGIAC